MGQSSKGISASFPVAEHAEITKRCRELHLPARGGLSLYFQLLREFDTKFHLRIYRHNADGQLHFYPENEKQAAEDDDGAGALLSQLLRKAERKASTPDAPAARRGRAARP